MAKSTQPAKVEMKLAKSTKNTHVYVNDDEKAVCNQVYLNKTALPDPAPKSVTLIVEVK